MPTICSSKIFENHNIIYLYSENIIKGCEFISKYLNFKVFYNKILDESYLFVKDDNKIVGILSYFFYQINNENVPAIDIVIIDEEYRRKGICKFLYKLLLNKHGKLISGICLNKNHRKIDGSYGLWIKLIKEHKPFLFNIYSNKVESFSLYKAFSSKHSIKRRILIWK